MNPCMLQTLENYWEEVRQHPFPPTNVWKMHLDGARSRHCVGDGVVLISHAGE